MLEIKFFGKEPEACIAMVKNEKGEASIEVKGSTRDILSMLTIMVAALKKKTTILPRRCGD